LPFSDNYQISSWQRMAINSFSHFQPLKMAARRLPGPPDAFPAVRKEKFSEKQAIFNNEIGQKPPSNKRKPLLFFTMVL
jgi:hypothetical protein